MIELTEEKSGEFQAQFVFEKDPKIAAWGREIERAFSGAYRKSFYVPGDRKSVLLVGCGDGAALEILKVRELAAFAARTLKELGIGRCCLDIGPLTERLGEASLIQIVLGLMLGTYEYQARCGEPGQDSRIHPAEWKNPGQEQQVCYQLYGAGAGRESRELVDEARELARDLMFVRDMVNTPGNLLRPMDFCRAIQQYLKDTRVEAEVISYEQLKFLGLSGLSGIGGSSEFPPCLLVLRYRGRPGAEENIGLIGKGVTCDTGGYCLKAAKSMAGIKGDMAGAAAVAGAVHGAAARGLKVNLTAVLPLCENRISPSSHLPGDVIFCGGKTVEIVNTDAEGRLILADAISYGIEKEKITHVLDIATLTGAVWQALGYTIGGSMSDDEAFYRMFERGLASCGERYLRFPFGEEHEKMIKSDVADLKNVGEDCCGVITAGLFLRHFAKGLPWIHLDIAGTAWNKTPLYAFDSKGATGAGALSLYYFLKEAEGLL